MNERWARPPGEIFEVSSDGRVRTMRGVRRLQLDRRGYVRTEISGGRRRAVYLYVMELFGPAQPSPLHEISHIDGDRTNDRVENLEWLTRTERFAKLRMRGVFATWKILRGSSAANALLNEKKVRQARALASKGETIAELARKYGVGRQTMSNAIKKRTWKHVED